MPVVMSPRGKVPGPPLGSGVKLGVPASIVVIVGFLSFLIYRWNEPRTHERRTQNVAPALNAQPTQPSIGSFASPSTAPQEDSFPPPGHIVKGNISVADGAKLYHVPGMRDYHITAIDPIRGERWFRTEAEAQAAGWVRADRRRR